MYFHLENHTFDINQPIDISISIHSGYGQVNAFYAPPFRFTPVKEGDFVGSTKLGGVVNFMNLQINPHGNGTHTECVGHISTEEYYVNECLRDFFTLSELISVYPNFRENGDKVIELQHLESLFENEHKVKSLIIRTLPNEEDKKSRNYSGSNPTYMSPEAMEYVVSKGIEHLLVDFPSVDKEQDEGKLSSHKVFWQYPSQTRVHSTITELIYVENKVKDGIYLLNNTIPNIKMDAVPSRPVLYSKV